VGTRRRADRRTARRPSRLVGSPGRGVEISLTHPCTSTFSKENHC
jgi:hypothetical protein